MEQITLWFSRARVLVTALLFTVALLVLTNYFYNLGHTACLAGSLDPSHRRPANSIGGEPQDGVATRQKHDNAFLQQRVESLVHQCSNGLFRIDTATLAPGFVVGDFDGDKFPDLFIAVRRARNIDVGDTSEPPFILQDILDATSPPGAVPTPTMGDLGRGEDHLFFVVFHHFQARSMAQCPSKRQKFVLFFTPDKGVSAIRVFHGKRLPPGTIGDPKEDEPAPRLKGDAILLVDDKSHGEALYWDGSRYRWYPFDGDPR